MTCADTVSNAIFLALPSWWRFMQCLKVYSTTYEVKNLWNALKYSSAFPLVSRCAPRHSAPPRATPRHPAPPRATPRTPRAASRRIAPHRAASTASRVDRPSDSHIQVYAGYLRRHSPSLYHDQCFILAACVQSTYCLIWDVHMDWGLFRSDPTGRACCGAKPVKMSMMRNPLLITQNKVAIASSIPTHPISSHPVPSHPVPSHSHPAQLQPTLIPPHPSPLASRPVPLHPILTPPPATPPHPTL